MRCCGNVCRLFLPSLLPHPFIGSHDGARMRKPCAHCVPEMKRRILHLGRLPLAESLRKGRRPSSRMRPLARYDGRRFYEKFRARAWFADARSSGRVNIRDIQSEEGEFSYDQSLQIHGRQHGGGACVLCVHRGGGHLSDHPVEPHGGLRRPVVGAGPQEHLRHHGQGRRDGIRGRCGGHRARLSFRRRADHHLHGVPGPAPHDSEYV